MQQVSASAPAPPFSSDSAKRAQAHLRCRIEELHRQLAVADIEPVCLEHDRLDLARDEIAHGVADFQLFGG